MPRTPRPLLQIRKASQLPERLRTPLELPKLRTKCLQQAAIQQRLTELLAVYGIEHTAADAIPRLALSLATTYIPGFQVLLHPVGHNSKAKKNKGGRPRLLIDRVQLVMDIEAITDTGKTVMVACTRLARQRKFAGSAKQLANQYYKHAHSVKAAREYVADCADRLCARHPSTPCFDMNKFNEAELQDLPHFCGERDNCPYFRSITQILAASDSYEKAWIDGFDKILMDFRGQTEQMKQLAQVAAAEFKRARGSRKKTC